MLNHAKFWWRYIIEFAQFKGTVWPDWIYMRVVPLDRPRHFGLDCGILEFFTREPLLPKERLISLQHFWSTVRRKRSRFEHMQTVVETSRRLEIFLQKRLRTFSNIADPIWPDGTFNVSGFLVAWIPLKSFFWEGIQLVDNASGDGRFTICDQEAARIRAETLYIFYRILRCCISWATSSDFICAKYRISSETSLLAFWKKRLKPIPVFGVSIRIPFLQLTSKRIRIKSLDLAEKFKNLQSFLLCFRRYQWRLSVGYVDEKDKPMWTGTSVADPGSGTFLTPGAGMGKKFPDPWSVIIPDHFPDIEALLDPNPHQCLSLN